MVAMTGDGINERSALKHANLVLRWVTLLPATKAVSRLVLLDGKFSSLPAALEQGVRSLSNIEMVANLFLTKTGFRDSSGGLCSASGSAFPFCRVSTQPLTS